MSLRPISARPLPGPSPAEVAQAAVVMLAVTQALLLALWLGLLPRLALRMGGFPPAPPFFVRWAGLLQAILAIAYALEWQRFGRVGLLVVAKGLTAVFLAVTLALDGFLPLLFGAVFIEGGLAIAASLLQRPAARSRLARGRLRLVARPAPPVRPAGQR